MKKVVLLLTSQAFINTSNISYSNHKFERTVDILSAPSLRAMSLLKLIVFYAHVCLAVGFSNPRAVLNIRNGALDPLYATPRNKKLPNNGGSNLRFSPSNTTSIGAAMAAYDPMTPVFDEAAFVEALYEQLPDLERLTDNTLPNDARSSLLPSVRMQFQDTAFPQNRNNLPLHYHQSQISTSYNEGDDEITARTSSPEDVWTARYLLLGAAALYGTNFALIKLLGDTMPVGISSTLRFGFAAGVLFPWLIMDRKQDWLQVTWLGFEVGLWNSIGYVTQAVGLETTEASKSAFICSLAVVVVPLLDFLSGKRLASRQWIAVILAVLGVAFLELGGETSLSSLSSGDILSLVQPLVFGIGFWRMERAMHNHPDGAARLTAAQLLAVFLASAGYCILSIDSTELVNEPWMLWVSDPSLLFSLFWTGVVTTALTIYMETWALKTLSAADTTLIFSTEPVFGAAFASAVMGEQLGMGAGLGAFLILTACIYGNMGMKGIQSLLPSSGTGAKGEIFDTCLDGDKRGFPRLLNQQWQSLRAKAATLTTSALNYKSQQLRTMEDMEERFKETIQSLWRKHQ